MNERIRIKTTKTGIPIILKSTLPFDELTLSISNILHNYDVKNMGITFEEITSAISTITKKEPTRNRINKAYERMRKELWEILK